MFKKTNRIGIYVPLLLILSSIAIIFRTISIFEYFNTKDGYFKNTRLLNASIWIVAIGAFLLLSYTFLAPKIKKLRFNFNFAENYVIVCAVSLGIAFLIFSLYLTPAAEGVQETVKGLIYLFAGISLLYFIGMLFANSQISEVRGILSLAPALLCALYGAYLYFDTTLPLNAPSKLTDQIAYLFCALFFLFESRVSLGREAYRGYISLALVCSLLCSYASIPTLIYYFGRGKIISNSIYDAFLLFALAIYAFARAIRLNYLKEDIENSFIAAIRESADEAEAGIHSNEEAARLAFITDFNARAEQQLRLQAEAELKTEPSTDSSDESVEDFPMSEQVAMEIAMPSAGESITDFEQVNISGNEDTVASLNSDSNSPEGLEAEKADNETDGTEDENNNEEPI